MQEAGLKPNGPLRVAAVLFDLDGTLIDSAPDLAGAGNDMRAARGLSELPYEPFRRMAGAGARGMVGVAFGVGPDDPSFAALRDEFLDRYEKRMLSRTALFPAMVPVLDHIEQAGLRWGVVTNKLDRFTRPLLQGLHLDPRAGCIVSGDTTPHAKPHPAPLLEAARRIGVAAQACVYVGDDLRDVRAGRAAGMATLIAAWGYLGAGEPIDEWQADGVLQSPADLLKWLHTT